ncbi:hypothetical protein CWS02_11950 [Enterobacter sp. EA-1]|nr:hypothetical protein CWS02_11950 [Enterobacter sp. EA-1]
MHGCANDVLAHMTLHMREESCAAYQQALDFIVRLLEQGFPRHYHITLKSTVKAFLPVKGLARSDTHRFLQMRWATRSCMGCWNGMRVWLSISMNGTPMRKRKKTVCPRQLCRLWAGTDQ